MAELPSAASAAVEDVAEVGATEAGTAGRSFRPCGEDVERLLKANKFEGMNEYSNSLRRLIRTGEWST